MEAHECYICGSYKRGGALKKISEDVFICSKGLCRKMYNIYPTLEECKDMYAWSKAKYGDE